MMLFRIKKYLKWQTCFRVEYGTLSSELNPQMNNNRYVFHNKHKAM